MQRKFEGLQKFNELPLFHLIRFTSFSTFPSRGRLRRLPPGGKLSPQATDEGSIPAAALRQWAELPGFQPSTPGQALIGRQMHRSITRSCRGDLRSPAASHPAPLLLCGARRPRRANGVKAIFGPPRAAGPTIPIETHAPHRRARALPLPPCLLRRPTFCVLFELPYPRGIAAAAYAKMCHRHIFFTLQGCSIPPPLNKPHPQRPSTGGQRPPIGCTPRRTWKSCVAHQRRRIGGEAGSSTHCRRAAAGGRGRDSQLTSAPVMVAECQRFCRARLSKGRPAP